MTLPSHGRINCTRCFDGAPVTWGVSFFERDGWRLENNPGAWGSAAPLILVLGVSKGTNQCNLIIRLPHNDIPFKGERPALSKILARLGLLRAGEKIDARISASESVFGFGSLIRCSIAMFDRSKGQWVKAGPVVKASATNQEAQKFVANCANEFLADLPIRTKLLVLLSNDDDYIDSCYLALKRLYPDIVRHNAVSYGNKAHTWVHVVHSSGSSGRHIPDWLSKLSGKQALKREAALAAIRHSGVLGELGA